MWSKIVLCGVLLLFSCKLNRESQETATEKPIVDTVIDTFIIEKPIIQQDTVTINKLLRINDSLKIWGRFRERIVLRLRDTIRELRRVNDSLLAELADSNRYNYIDTLVYRYDTIMYDTTIYDTVTIMRDSIVYDTVLVNLFSPPDTVLFRFIEVDSTMMAPFLIRPVMDALAIDLDKPLIGSTRIINHSYNDYVCDSSVYIDIILYDSTFSKILFTKEIVIPSLDALEEMNIDWNSGEWIIPTSGWYYIRRVFYKKIEGYKDQPVRGFYIGFEIE